MGARGNVEVGGQAPMKAVTNGASRMPARSQAPRSRPAPPPASSNRTPMRPGKNKNLGIFPSSTVYKYYLLEDKR